MKQKFVPSDDVFEPLDRPEIREVKPSGVSFSGGYGRQIIGGVVDFVDSPAGNMASSSSVAEMAFGRDYPRYRRAQLAGDEATMREMLGMKS